MRHWLFDQWIMCHLLQRGVELPMCAECLPELQLRQRNLYLFPVVSLGNRSVGGSGFHSARADDSCNLSLPQKLVIREKQSGQLGLQTVSTIKLKLSKSNIQLNYFI